MFDKEDSGKHKLLIVDDEKDLCSIIKKNLELTDEYKVDIANSGKAALWYLRWNKPDLILLDIMMPGIDGLEVLKKIKENPATLSIPVIMVTAKGDEDSKEKATSLYDEDYIVKPVELEILKIRIENALLRGKRL